MIYNTYYDEYFSGKQEKIKVFYEELKLPEDDPIHTLKEIVKELDFSELLEQYSEIGRKATNPIMLFSLLVYANMRGIRSVKQIVKMCKRDICFMSICQNEAPSYDTIYRFKNSRVTVEILDNLHYQFINLLKENGHVGLEKLFVDGTKIEANANRYTFVWRGSINYHLANLIANINELYTQYNEFITKNEYDTEYDMSKAQMLVISGMDKVNEVIQKNRQLKKNNQSKISNNSIVKIENMDIESLRSIRHSLYIIAEQENISLFSGKGHKKSELLELHRDAQKYMERLEKYADHFEIMGGDRNSYSKTDNDATFMRMKDDHMRNGQLKPGYNVQFGTENHFIIDILLTNDRTDYHTLIPLVEKHAKNTNVRLKEFIADSGYCSEKGLGYLVKNNIEPYIKLQMHEVMKTRKYKNDIGKHYNMKTLDDGTYICASYKQLPYLCTSKSNRLGYEQEFRVYECEDCSGCSLKEKCFYNYHPEKHANANKRLKINHNWEELKARSNKNIQSKKGILYRQIRSLQSEGAFGNMKENNDFRRFNNRSYDKSYKELAFYAFGANVNKLHRYNQGILRPPEVVLAA